MGDNFPYLDEHTEFRFPPVENATPEGIVGVGGNLSPGMLLSAYRQGIFPWFNPGEPLLWWSPDPRFVLFTEELHVSKSMKKLLRKDRYKVTFDTQFAAVIHGCKTVPRRGLPGTWITGDMERAYIKLHALGYAHSVEVWDNDALVGGLYGVSLGSCFFGESMFSRVSSASKIALITMARTLLPKGLTLIDCQVYTPHLEKLGARLIPRGRFLQLLGCGLKRPSMWN